MALKELALAGLSLERDLRDHEAKLLGEEIDLRAESIRPVSH
jgi:hypothetical protein